MKKTTHALILSLLTLVYLPLLAVTKPELSGRCRDMMDISFNVSSPPANAIDVEFTATFTDSAGTELIVPGFYNGGNEYLVRFTPSSPGIWTFATTSIHSELNNQKGTINTAPALAGRRGGIIVDPKNNRAFSYENGERYYPIAYEVDWLFALDAENNAGIPKSKMLIDTAAKNGFNQIVMNVFAYDVKWQKDSKLTAEFDYGSPKVFPFGGDNTTPDHSTINIDYFKKLDRVIQYLDEKDIVAHLMIYVWNKRVNWAKADSIEDNRYYDYVVKRYQAYPNMVWDISKEALGYGHEDPAYITRRIERLRKLDSYKRLVTVHDYGYCKNYKENIDFISIQSWKSEIYSTMRRIRDEIPGMPLLSIEHGGYEKARYSVFNGAYNNAEHCLERSYKCMFAGTFPSHYWQDVAWNVVIHDISAMEPEERPKLHYYKHMRTLADRYPLGSLIPTTQKGNNGFCLHDKGENLFIYLLPKESIGLGGRLPKNKVGKQYTLTWFDPLTGEYSKPVKKEVKKFNYFHRPSSKFMSIAIVEIEDK